MNSPREDDVDEYESEDFEEESQNYDKNSNSSDFRVNSNDINLENSKKVEIENSSSLIGKTLENYMKEMNFLKENGEVATPTDENFLKEKNNTPGIEGLGEYN